MARLSQKPAHYLERDNYATRAQTMDQLFQHWNFSLESEQVSLCDAMGRVSAEDVFSNNTLPVCRAAAADGVAVRFNDFENGLPDFSCWKENIDYAPADMGDDFDDCFDTVLWVENFTFGENDEILSIDLEEPVTKGQLVRERGATLKANEQVLKSGDVITPFRAGLLASAGIKQVCVKRRPKIAYIPTGNELIPAGGVPNRGENIESNSLMITGLGVAWGAQVICLPIIKDQKAELEKALNSALQQADIVIVNGGSSMGTEDYTSTILKKRASYFQHGVRCIPGIPVAVAIVEEKLVINLPGPPYAAFCAMDWCVRGLIYHFSGLSVPQRCKVFAQLDGVIQKPPIHEMYVRIALSKNPQGHLIASPIPMHVRYTEAAARWNGLFIAPIGESKWESGSTIEVEMI